MQLKLTCGACPEQYSLLDDAGVEIGYFRLRHGAFRAEDGYGNTVYSSTPLASDGIFVDDERAEHMIPAIDAVLAAAGRSQEGLARRLLASADGAIEDWIGEAESIGCDGCNAEPNEPCRPGCLGLLE